MFALELGFVSGVLECLLHDLIFHPSVLLREGEIGGFVGEFLLLRALPIPGNGRAQKLNDLGGILVRHSIARNIALSERGHSDSDSREYTSSNSHSHFGFIAGGCRESNAIV